jgi:pimeloyl-ACP methyl ester carboxylesterase
MPGFTSSTLTVGGLEVVVLDSADVEPTDGVTFILVHGLGVSSLYFRDLAGALAERARVVAVDLPGFGHADRPDDALRVGSFARVLGAVLELLGPERPVLVGHSMGVQVVVEALARQPGLAERAILLGPVVRPADRRALRLVRRFMQSAAHETFSSAWLSVIAWLRCGPRWFVEIFPAMLNYPLEDRIADVAVPTMLLAGEHDLMAPRAWLEDLAARTAGPATVEVVSGAAHQVMVSHTRLVADLCMAFAEDP